ncbi:HAD family hydrolase [Streptomyces sp. NPDC005279]|uniref:HAD family hydrolase n=1 Tax=Streptomyces sp. NPDC005279 TaxID=3364712 RepID=UPI0036C09EC9
MIAALGALETVVFDTDGVITDSARLHAAAWKTASDTWPRDHPPTDPGPRRPFDPREDCLRYVDGRPRTDSAASFPAADGMRLPDAGVRRGAASNGGDAGLGLPGKPDQLFLEAARRLGTPAGRTAVAEDALAGVEAGRRGGSGRVVGVDRTPGPDSGAALLRRGAALVVRDLADLLSDGADDAKG